MANNRSEVIIMSDHGRTARIIVPWYGGTYDVTYTWLNAKTAKDNLEDAVASAHEDARRHGIDNDGVQKSIQRFKLPKPLPEIDIACMAGTEVERLPVVGARLKPLSFTLRWGKHACTLYIGAAE